ncbi:MAG: tetratricopeptide repeat protein [Bryobacteraceae bacterium]
MTKRILAVWLAVACAGLVQAQRSGVDAAWDLVAKGRRGEAVTLLWKIVQSEPRNAEARLLLGSLLMEAGQHAASIEQMSTAVRLLPNSAEAHNALGEAFHAAEDNKAARPEFERAVAIDPAFAQAHVNLGLALLELGEMQSASAPLDRALRLLGRSADAALPHYLRAKICTENGDVAGAAAHLEQAVALRPDFEEAWSDLGEARKALLDDAGAIAAYQRAVNLNPDDAVPQTRLGLKLLDLGRAHEAVPHLREAVRLDPKNQSALYGLQSALKKDGQAEQAEAVRRQLAELIRERDRNDQALVRAVETNNRGAELEKKGDLRGALEKYGAALELQPEHVGIRINLGVALLKLGQWNEGIAQLREALRRDPGNRDLKQALEDALAQARAHGIVIATP